MRKRNKFIAVAALTVALFAGCRNKDINIDVTALADDLKSSVSFVDTLDQLSAAGFKSYEIDESDISAKSIYLSAASAEEIAVFEAVDNAAASRIRDAVDAHVLNNIDSYEDYNPEALRILDDPVIIQKGKYVILCISEDNDAALRCIEKYTK